MSARRFCADLLFRWRIWRAGPPMLLLPPTSRRTRRRRFAAARPVLGARSRALWREINPGCSRAGSTQPEWLCRSPPARLAHEMGRYFKLASMVAAPVYDRKARWNRRQGRPVSPEAVIKDCRPLTLTECRDARELPPPEFINGQWLTTPPVCPANRRDRGFGKTHFGLAPGKCASPRRGFPALAGVA